MSDQLKQASEYLEDAGEYSLAYELLVSLLERFPFRISGNGAVKLLEAGLTLGYKTGRVEDADFDRRKKR